MKWLFIILMSLIGYSYCQSGSKEDFVTKPDLKYYPKLDKFGNIDIAVIRQGKGSLLDADRLDGLDSSQFMRSDSTGTNTSNLTIGAGALQVLSTFTIRVAPNQNLRIDSDGSRVRLRGETDSGGGAGIDVRTTSGFTFSTGNVGIGTTSASSLFHIKHETNANVLFDVANSTPRIRSETDAGGARALIISAGNGLTLSVNAAAGGSLCLNSQNVLSKCTSVVDANGNCTCP